MTDSAFAGLMLGIPIGMLLMLVILIGVPWAINAINAWQDPRQGRRG